MDGPSRDVCVLLEEKKEHILCARRAQEVDRRPLDPRERSVCVEAVNLSFIVERAVTLKTSPTVASFTQPRNSTPVITRASSSSSLSSIIEPIYPFSPINMSHQHDQYEEETNTPVQINTSTAPPPPPKKRSHVAKPDDFTGKDWDKFMRQIMLYIAANKADFDTNESKVLFVLTYMKDGLAGQWANNFIDEVSEEAQEGGEPDWGTYQSLIIKLNTAFGDQNKKKTAQEKLSHATMGNRTASEFLNYFEQQVRAAGYQDGHDQYLIELLERALKPSIVSKIYGQETVPDTYEEWKSKAIRLDGLEHRFAQIQNRSTASATRRPPTHQNQNQQQPKYTADSRAPQKVQQNQDGSRWITFGGRGQPMQLDEARKQGVCFKCGEQGHIGKFCPRAAPAQVRAVQTEDDTRTRLRKMTHAERLSLLGEL